MRQTQGRRSLPGWFGSGLVWGFRGHQGWGGRLGGTGAGEGDLGGTRTGEGTREAPQSENGRRPLKRELIRDPGNRCQEGNGASHFIPGEGATPSCLPGVLTHRSRELMGWGLQLLWWRCQGGGRGDRRGRAGGCARALEPRWVALWQAQGMYTAGGHHPGSAAAAEGPVHPQGRAAPEGAPVPTGTLSGSGSRVGHTPWGGV